MSMPAYGVDEAAETDDTYAEVIAARTGNEVYNYAIAWCSTKDALISLDAGTTDHFPVKADQAPMRVDFDRRSKAVHGKNLKATEDYTYLYVIIGYDPAKDTK